MFIQTWWRIVLLLLTGRQRAKWELWLQSSKHCHHELPQVNPAKGLPHCAIQSWWDGEVFFHVRVIWLQMDEPLIWLFYMIVGFLFHLTVIWYSSVHPVNRTTSTGRVVIGWSWILHTLVWLWHKLVPTWYSNSLAWLSGCHEDRAELPIWPLQLRWRSRTVCHILNICFPVVFKNFFFHPYE